MKSLIATRNLTKRYGDIQAVAGVNLEIPAGRIVGLVGPNGAGKTTLLRALTGQIEYDGEIQILDREPYSQRPALMMETGVIHDVAVLPEWMRVTQLLDFMTSIHPGFDEKCALSYLERTTIPLNQKIRNLSKGMKTQLHLSLVLATNSRLLILDEPSHGLDILFRKQLYSSVLEDYFDEEKSILISTHQIEEVEHILSDVIFIKEGQIKLYASMEELDQRFTQITIPRDREEDFLKEFKVLTGYGLLGRKVFLVEAGDRDELAKWGDVQAPSVADIFVAIMGDPALNQTGGAA